MDEVTITVAGPADMADVYALRERVFVVEQHVPVDIERDTDDEVAVHVVARAPVSGEVVGTGRLVPDGERGRVGRMAVAPEWRGRGLGSRVLAALEDAARSRGFTGVDLHAQAHALGFYERAGYEAHGDEFDEAGIPHRHMRKPLRA